MGTPSPGLPDQANQFVVTGANPATALFLFTGELPGSTAVAGCPGLELSIRSPDPIANRTTNAAGSLIFNPGIPAVHNNHTRLYQALDMANCEVSDPVVFTWSVPDLSGTWDVLVADGVLEGNNHMDLFGTREDLEGDADGDGLADLLISAVWHDGAGTRSGITYLYYGTPSGIVSATEAQAKFQGEHPKDWSGIDIAWAGDVNGDGFDDALIGARKYDGMGPESNSGAVYLFYMPLFGAYSVADADSKFLGEAAGDEAGKSLARAGDLNADGFDDFLIGAPFEDTGGIDAGAAYVLYGPPAAGITSLALADAKLTGVAAGDQAGTRVTGLGDINNDGFDDIAIGAPMADIIGVDDGAIYIFHGPIFGPLTMNDADAIIHGANPGDQAGSEVAPGHDINGDGELDLLVTARMEPTGGVDAGTGYVVQGPLTGTISLASAAFTFYGESSGDKAGGHLTTCDHNGDGHPDLLVTANRAHLGGMSYVIDGPLSGTLDLSNASTRLVTQRLDQNLGQDVTCGDIDGDGLDDMLFGAETADTSGGIARNGAAYLFYGR